MTKFYFQAQDASEERILAEYCIEAIKSKKYALCKAFSAAILHRKPKNITFIELYLKSLLHTGSEEEIKLSIETYHQIALTSSGMQIVFFDFYVRSDRFHEAIFHVWKSLTTCFFSESWDYFITALSELSRNNKKFQDAILDLDSDLDIDPLGRILHAFSDMEVDKRVFASGREVVSSKSARAKVKETIEKVMSTPDIFQVDDRFPILLNSEKLAAILLENEKEVLVSFSHDNYHKNSGGVQLCLRIEETRAIDAGLDYLHISPKHIGNTLLPEKQISTSSFEILLNGQIIGLATYATIIKALKDSKVEKKKFTFVVHHLLGHDPNSLTEVIFATGERSCYLWLHDFFLFCTNYRLLRNNISFCGGPEMTSNSCQICIFGEKRKQHIEKIQRFLNNVNVKLIAPSEFVKEFYQNRYFAQEHEILTIEHAKLRANRKDEITLDDASLRKKPFRFAFVGAPIAQKGWDIFSSLHKMYAKSSEYEFHYFGNGMVSEDYISHNLSVHSANHSIEMSRRIKHAEIDFLVHMAPWPETFSFTSYEALAGGAFILTLERSGNIARIVKDTKKGRVFHDPSELYQWLGSEDFHELLMDLRSQKFLQDTSISLSQMTVDAIESGKRK